MSGDRNRKYGLIDGSMVHQRALSLPEDFSKRSEVNDHKPLSASEGCSYLRSEAALGKSKPYL